MDGSVDVDAAAISFSTAPGLRSTRCEDAKRCRPPEPFRQAAVDECGAVVGLPRAARWPLRLRRSQLLRQEDRAVSGRGPIDRQEWPFLRCDRRLPIRRFLSSVGAIHRRPRSPRHRFEVLASSSGTLRRSVVFAGQINNQKIGDRFGLSTNAVDGRPRARSGPACRPASGCEPSAYLCRHRL